MTLAPDQCPHCSAILNAAALSSTDPVPPPNLADPRSEAALQRAVLTQFGALPALRLFRNSVGIARDTTTGQHVRFGLAVGSSDLIAIVAPHGRFLAAELKSARGTATPAQLAFLATVRRNGGVSGLVRSPADFAALLAEAQR